MAKKNSTKTATKEAMENSQPRLQLLKGWQGIHIQNAPANWSYMDDSNAQTDLQMNFMTVQNNAMTTDNLTIETRPKDSILFNSDEFELTGVSYMKSKWLYMATSDGGLIAHDVTSDDPNSFERVGFSIISYDNFPMRTYSIPDIITHIYSYLNNEQEYLIVMCEDDDGNCRTLTGRTDSTGFAEYVENAIEIPTPDIPATLVSHNIMPHLHAVDFWDTMFRAYTTFVSYDPIASTTTTITISNKPQYAGYSPSNSMYSTYIAKNSYVICGNNAHYKDSNGVYHFLRYDDNTPQSDKSAYFKAYWEKMLYEDGITFDRAFIYHRYDSGQKVPASVTANNWISNTIDANLTTPTTIDGFGADVTLKNVISNTSIDATVSGAATAWTALKSSDNASEFCSWGYTKSGDLWVAFRALRGSTGYECYLYYAKSPDVDRVDEDYQPAATINVMYAYANKFGQTSLSSGNAVLTFNPQIGPANWTLNKYATITIPNVPSGYGIDRINIYYTMDESYDPAFMGSIIVDPNSDKAIYSYDWYGASADVGEWSDANLTPDSINTTAGPDARYCRMHDGRIYFWGSRKRPYRLTIGGNPGHELCVARGLGGAHIDIEPGIGTIVNGTHKWKTASGASIITILCGNENTTQHKRFNLIENNITVDNELSEQSYMVEEVANTIGCQSVWGSGVWSDGLYVLSRYGLTITTMAMEYNSQMQSQVMSDNVQPVFTSALGTMMDDAVMRCIDEVIYISFGLGNGDLDRVILCYDIGNKSWYTYTYGDEDTSIRHLLNIDYKGAVEGLGIICSDHVALIPTTGSQDYVKENKVDVVVETGELSTNTPTTASSYVAQIEMRFDWLIGDVDVYLDGVDYYGRHVEVHRHIHVDEVVNDFIDWMRVNYILENYHIRIVGNSMFRLTHIVAKVYPQNNSFGLTRGFDSLATYKSRHGYTGVTRHYIRNYANLRETILP